MALVSCGGADVLAGEIHLCAHGASWAQLRLDAATAPAGKVTVAAAAGLSLSGFVLAGGVFCDVAEISIVGGAGGLGTVLPASAWENAQLRDPLNAAMSASGEALSTTVAASLLGVLLPAWTRTAETTARALDALAGAAAAQLGQATTWRVLGDGTIWLGTESWPSEDLPRGSEVLEAFPAQGRYVIGADTPSLLPGVALTGVGNVVAVDHWLTADEVRTWAWV